MRTSNPTKLIAFQKQDMKAECTLAAWNQVDAGIPVMQPHNGEDVTTSVLSGLKTDKCGTIDTGNDLENSSDTHVCMHPHTHAPGGKFGVGVV
jgi:hypothetical protein